MAKILKIYQVICVVLATAVVAGTSYQLYRLISYDSQEGRLSLMKSIALSNDSEYTVAAIFFTVAAIIYFSIRKLILLLRQSLAGYQQVQQNLFTSQKRQLRLI